MEDHTILFPAPTINDNNNNQQPLESQSQQQNDNNNNNKFSQVLTQLSKEEQEKLRELLNDRSKKLNENCVLMHLLSQLVENGINIDISRDFQKIYKDFNNRDLNDRQERIFDEFCSPCTFVKFGLISENVIKPLQNTSCLMNPTNSGNIPYNMGPFIHAVTAFEIDEKKHPYNINNSFAKNCAFPPGVIILPDSKIMMQILAMGYDKIINGVKVCMINSDETNVTDPKIISRFMRRNRLVNCGYYKRNPQRALELNVKKRKRTTTMKMRENNNNNKKKIIKGDNVLLSSNLGIRGEDKDVETVKIPPLSDDDDDGISLINLLSDNNNNNDDDDDDSSSSDDDDDNIKNNNNYRDNYTAYIPSVDDDDNFDENNIFQNGEPLIYKSPEDDPLKPDEIGMRIFDVNNVLITYLRTMSNLQAYVENQYNNQQKNDKHRSYILNPSMIQDSKLISTTFYDLLAYIYHGSINHDELLELPPFNGKCILHNTNILFVNRHGRAITDAYDVLHEKNKCNSFNFIMKSLNDSPISHKIVPTASNTNLTSAGNVPNVVISKGTIKNWERAFERLTDEKLNSLPTLDDIKSKNSLIHTHHTSTFHSYHSMLKSTKDILTDYFCELKDDVGENVSYVGNEIFYDIARKIYPQKILDVKSNKKRHTLSFDVKNNTKPIIDKVQTPNVVYIPNLGLVSLTTICNMSPLTLQGSTVYYPNVVNKFDGEKNKFITKSSKNCMLNNSDDEEETIGNVLAERVSHMPSRNKVPDNAIKVYGEGDNFDHGGHLRRLNCEKPNFVRSYLENYQNEKNPACLKSI